MDIKIEKIKTSSCGHSFLSGRKRDRLVIGADKKIAITCKKALSEEAPYPKFFGKKRYVRLHINQEIGWVDLNINSLCKRLQISKADFKERRENGTLKNLILQALKPNKPRSQSVLPETLEERVKKQFEVEGSPGKYDQEKLNKYGITKYQLTTVLQQEGAGFHTFGREQEKQFYIDKTNPDPKKHKLYLVHTHIKAGSVARVSKFVRLDKPSKSKKAIKIPHFERDNRLMANDPATLEAVHDRGEKAPHKDSKGQLIGIHPRAKLLSTGEVIAKRGKGDLTKFFGAALKVKQKFALEVLMGCANLQSIGIIHLDIKPENILCRRNEEGVLCAELIDFGGSYKGPGFPALANYTPEYCSEGAWSNLGDPQKFYQYDLFSTGLSLYYLFTGSEAVKSIFQLNEARSPIESSFNEAYARQQMKRNKVPSSMQEIIIKMIKMEEGYDFNHAVSDWQRCMV